jgi:hypothetical protein
MKKILLGCILMVSTFTSNSVLKADWAIDVVVAKDGSGYKQRPCR